MENNTYNVFTNVIKNLKKNKNIKYIRDKKITKTCPLNTKTAFKPSK